MVRVNLKARGPNGEELPNWPVLDMPEVPQIGSRILYHNILYRVEDVLWDYREQGDWDIDVFVKDGVWVG